MMPGRSAQVFVQQLEELETLAAQLPADYDELPATAAMAEPKPVVSDAWACDIVPGAA